MRTDLSRRNEGLRRPIAPQAAVVALTVPSVLLLASLTPSEFLLPALSLAAMAAAGLAALLGWACGERWAEDRITLWDIAGAFVLIASAAGIFSEPENVLQMFGGRPAP